MRIVLYIFLILVSLQSATAVYGNNSVIIVDSIAILGNKKTKTPIMLRELTFKKGDTIPLSILSAVLEQNRLRLMNTNLFLKTQMNIKDWKEDNRVVVLIEVTENWFLFPIPIFEIADRNFNVWWKEQNHSFKRTNYGIRLIYNNLTGRRDPLSATVQLGYTPKYSFSYSLPFINKKQTWGLSASYFNAVNREVGYATDDNKLSFFRDANKFLLNRTNFSIGLNHTPKLLTNFAVSIGYAHNKVDSVIGNSLNKDYYLNGKLHQKYAWLAAGFSYDNRDIRPYPLHGRLFTVNLMKSGLFTSDDINGLDISSRLAQYFSLSSKISLEMIVKGKMALIRKLQPYTHMRGLGYGNDNLRGYDYYVVDGLDYMYSKNSFRYELLNKTYDLSKWIKWKLLKNWVEMPLKIYLTSNFDTGYVNNPFEKENNKMTNRQLYGGGVGIDIIAYYNMSWRFEYSLNHLGEKGLFFNYFVGF